MGKRVKVDDDDDDNDISEPLLFIPQPVDTDCELFKDCLKVQSYDMVTYIGSLSISELEKLMGGIEKQKTVKNGNVKQMVKPFLEFDKNLNSLKVCK